MPDARMDLSWDDLARYFGEMGDQLGKMSYRDPLRDVGLYLAMEARLCFDGQHAPDGAALAPFARMPSRKRGGGTAQLLRDTGILMASLISRAMGHHEELTDTALVWGTDVDYAGFHQSGTRYMPARPFLGITPPMEEKIVQILLHHVEKQLGFTGGGQAA